MKRYYRKKKLIRTRKAKRTSYKRRYSRKPGRAFAKKVQSVINKNLEDKFAYRTYNDVNFNSSIDTITDVYALMPNISNGNNDYQRIGDQIRAKGLTVTGYMITNMTNTSYSNARIGIRIMVVQPKSYVGKNAISNNATTWLNNLIKVGGTTQAFNGTPKAFLAPINTDAITVYADQRYYASMPYVPGTNTGDISSANTTKFFRIPFRIKNKLLRYEAGEDSGLTPTNWNPVFLLGYCKLDSGTPDTLTANVNLNMEVRLYYQDA